MKITWLGHSGFRIEIGDQVLLIDPWLTGNPMFPADQRAEAISGATHILISHAHGDHCGDALELAKELDIPLVGTFDLIAWWEDSEGIQGVGFNKGGSVMLGDVRVTMVHAVHSSTLRGSEGPVTVGSEAGFMISHNQRTIYFSGDTDVTMDMQIMQDLHTPEIGILCAGGHFTMDMRRASYAARTFFDFKTVIPCHYRTFSLLEQDASIMKDNLPDIDIIEPEVLEPIVL